MHWDHQVSAKRSRCPGTEPGCTLKQRSPEVRQNQWRRLSVSGQSGMRIKRIVFQKPNHHSVFQGKCNWCICSLEIQNLRPDLLSQNLKFHGTPRWFRLHTHEKKHRPRELSLSPGAATSFLALCCSLNAPAMLPLHGLRMNCSFCLKRASSRYLRGSNSWFCSNATLSEIPFPITLSNRATPSLNSFSPSLSFIMHSSHIMNLFDFYVSFHIRMKDLWK